MSSTVIKVNYCGTLLYALSQTLCILIVLPEKKHATSLGRANQMFLQTRDLFIQKCSRNEHDGDSR